MPLDASRYLKCTSDSFTQVRNVQGDLLGCVPKILGESDTLVGQAGRRFELRIAGIVCVLVTDKQSPHDLIGFTALDDDNADLALPVTIDDDDTDLAEGI